MKRIVLVLMIAVVLACSAWATGKQEPKPAAVPAAAPAAEVKPVLKIVRLESPTVAIPNEGFETKLIEQVTGYKVSIEYYDMATGLEKVILDISGGKVIDIVLPVGTNMMMMYSQLFQLGKSKAVVDMGPLLDKYAPDLKAVFPKATWDACKVDGKNYFAPAEGFDIPQNGDILRDDLLAKLGLAMPKSLADLVSLLKAVREKDPAGVGKENVIPLALVSTGLPFGSQFGINYAFVEKNGKLVHRLQLPETREHVRFLKMLYDEGLMDRDFLVSKMDVITQKVMANRVFMFGNAHWTNLYSFRDTADKQKLAISFKPVPTFPGPYGDYEVSSSFGLGLGAIIPATSKNPEHVMRYLNEWVKGDNFKKLYTGIEGVHHKVVNGEIYPILPKYNEEVGNMNLLLPVAPRETFFKYWLPRTRKLPLVESSFNDIYQTFKGKSRANPLALALSFPTYSANSAKLATLERDMALKMIVGTEKIENWDSQVKVWLDSGGANGIKEVNDWYAANK